MFSVPFCYFSDWIELNTFIFSNIRVHMIGHCTQLVVVSTYVFQILFYLFWTYKWKYSASGPSTYVYCVVSYRVMAATCVTSAGCVFAHLYTLVDDLKSPWTMSCFTTQRFSIVWFGCRFIFVYKELSSVSRQNLENFIR